jgi:glutamate formiminotransferase
VTALLAVPNVSEGRDPVAIERIGRAFDAQLLDVHSDPDHHRTVFTLVGGPGKLAQAVASGAREATDLIDVWHHAGLHPRVGALDVAPIVYLNPSDRGAACAEALVLADMLGHELELPVFLYGQLAGGRTRATLRRGGPAALAQRIDNQELRPDFGPRQLHARAGAVLVTARPPLVAFNVELAPPATLEDARAIAARIRETGPEGLPGVRAIGVWLAHRNVAQVSMNIEDHQQTPLVQVVAAIERHTPVSEAEQVGLAPSAAFAGFPERIPVRNKRLLEETLASASGRPGER